MTQIEIDADILAVLGHDGAVAYAKATYQDPSDLYVRNGDVCFRRTSGAVGWDVLGTIREVTAWINSRGIATT